MIKVIAREKQDTIAEKIRVSEVAPQLGEINHVIHKLERVKHLDKCRKIVAYNTLK